MEYLSNKYGLVTTNDPETENGQLFLAELILLQKQNIQSLEDYLDYTTYKSLMTKQLFYSQVEGGLYHRNPDLTDRRCMSHDNLSGIFAFSYAANTLHATEIWQYLISHFFTYDNTQGKSTQFSRFLPFNPSNYFMWGLMAKVNTILLLPFLPFLIINTIITCNKEYNDTSGKILSWVEMHQFREHFIVKYIFRYYENKMKKMYGDNYIKVLLSDIYFKNEPLDFPIKKILTK